MPLRPATEAGDPAQTPARTERSASGSTTNAFWSSPVMTPSPYSAMREPNGPVSDAPRMRSPSYVTARVPGTDGSPEVPMRAS